MPLKQTGLFLTILLFCGSAPNLTEARAQRMEDYQGYERRLSNLAAITQPTGSPEGPSSELLGHRGVMFTTHN